MSLKQAYSSWINKAPKRFKYDDNLVVMGNLPNWLVVRPDIGSPEDIRSYILIPREGYKGIEDDPFAPNGEKEVQANPFYFFALIQTFNKIHNL